MNSDTPETDAFYNRFGRTCDDEVEFAQKLERDRNELRTVAMENGNAAAIAITGRNKARKALAVAIKTKSPVSKSIVEESLSALWLIAGLLAWSNGFKWFAVFLFCKSAVDTLAALFASESNKEDQ